MSEKSLPSASPIVLTSTRGISASPDRPQADFVLLATRLQARVLQPGAHLRGTDALERQLRLDISQAVRARRATTSVYVSFSERVGIPLSILRPPSPHVLIAHLLTSSQKRLLARLSGFLQRTERVLVFSRAQERFLLDEVGLSPERARFIPDKVDHRFFSPAETSRPSDYILSVGREQRDYRTLLEAIRPLRLRCIIVPGSPWSHRGAARVAAGEHVEVRADVSYRSLVDLYRGARLVVIPIVPDIDYAAGVNSVLEAMSCQRPVIVSVTPGLKGYVRDREDGRCVRAGSSGDLRAAIEELWEDQDQAQRLASRAREVVEAGRTVEHFVARLASIIGEITA